MFEWPIKNIKLKDLKKLIFDEAYEHHKNAVYKIIEGTCYAELRNSQDFLERSGYFMASPIYTIKRYRRDYYVGLMIKYGLHP